MAQDQGFFPSANDSQGSANTQPPPSVAGGPEHVDTTFADELEQELASVKEESQRNRQEFQKVSKTLDNIKGAFGPHAEPTVDFDAQEKEELDYYLNAALEAEKAGRPIPLTAKLAVAKYEQSKRIRALEGKISELTKGVSTLADPETTYDNNAYAALETNVYNTIQSIYGEFDQHVGKACGEKLATEIKRIKKENPQGWNQIRSNPKHLESLAMYAVEKVIPPKAREIMKADSIKNTKMGRQDLLRALRENQEQTKDPALRNELHKKIRRDFLAEMLPFGK
jgi:hypothetical protein